MLNISKLKSLAKKKFFNLKTLCIDAVVSYDVITDKIRKGKQLNVDESEKLTSTFNKIITDVNEAVQ